MSIKDRIIKWAIAQAKDYVIKNWKTTLAGVLGNGLAVLLPGLAVEQRVALIGLVQAIVSTLAKDGDKSGTTEQPRTPPEVVEAQRSAVEAGVSPVSVVAGPANDREDALMASLRETSRA